MFIHMCNLLTFLNIIFNISLTKQILIIKIKYAFISILVKLDFECYKLLGFGIKSLSNIYNVLAIKREWPMFPPKRRRERAEWENLMGVNVGVNWWIFQKVWRLRENDQCLLQNVDVNELSEKIWRELMSGWIDEYSKSSWVIDVIQRICVWDIQVKVLGEFWFFPQMVGYPWNVYLPHEQSNLSCHILFYFSV